MENSDSQPKMCGTKKKSLSKQFDFFYRTSTIKNLSQKTSWPSQNPRENTVCLPLRGQVLQSQGLPLILVLHIYVHLNQIHPHLCYSYCVHLGYSLFLWIQAGHRFALRVEAIWLWNGLSHHTSCNPDLAPGTFCPDLSVLPVCK